MIPPQEVLALISWRCAALVLVYKFFWNAHRMFLSEDLVRSSIHRRSFFNDLLKLSYSRFSRCPGVRFWYEILMSRHRVASCAKTSSRCCSCDNVDPDLLLFHRYCCLYPAHWFPTPHTVWGLLPEYIGICFFFVEADPLPCCNFYLLLSLGSGAIPESTFLKILVWLRLADRRWYQ